MIRLYLLRHGRADHPAPGEWHHDSQRPLTEEGREEMRAAARGMRVLGMSFDAVLTSPYVRARQTADCVAAEHALLDRMTEAEALEPGGSLRDLARALRGAAGTSILVVGHAPDLGLWAGELTGTGEIPLKKGSLARVDVKGHKIEPGAGRLVMLLSVDLLARAGGH